MTSYSNNSVAMRRRIRALGQLCGAVFAVLLTTVAGAGGDTSDEEPNALARQVAAVRGPADALVPVRLFQSSTAQASRDAVTRSALASGTVLQPDAAALARLKAQRPPSLTLLLPTRERGEVELELVQQSLFAPGFTIEASGGEDTSVLDRGLHYRGIVKGEPRSFAAISVFGHEVMGIFSTPTEGNWVVGRLQADNPSDRHVVYAQSSLLDKNLALQCGTEGNGARDSFATFWPSTPASAQSPTETTKCVTQWLEAEYDIYQAKGSLQATTDYLTGLFNNSSALYANDGITLKLEKLHIWTTADPYNGSDTNASLSSFQQNRAGNFTGTVAQLLSSRSNGGLAAGFSGICASNRSSSMAVSMGLAEYSVVPTYSYTVEVVTHEVGHLLGSRHTHACVWNGNNTAIDGCGPIEGSCANPGIPPNGGGTIMSYCGKTTGGQRFENGFGPQPKQVIQNRIAAGSCLGNCDSGTNQPPTAAFNAAPSGLTVAFDATASSDSDGSIASYAWDFGDSSTGTGVKPSHSYASAGTYTVKLVVTDDDNATHSTSKSVTVSADGGSTVLQNGVAKTGLSAAVNTSLDFTLVVPAGASGLKFVTSGGSGDVDVYAKLGSAPTTSSYDCKSDTSSNSETCSIATAQAGTYYVKLVAYAAFSGVSLTGSYSTNPGGGFSNTTDYAIPDPGNVTSPITVSGQSGNASATTKVTVNIVHPYRGDVQIDLIAPNGQSVRLKSVSNDSGDDIHATYTVNASASTRNGQWRLKVSDLYSNDAGTLDDWSLQF